MKILAITARYPPCHFGGYELREKNIMDELSRRGHEILVVTSIKETKATVGDQPASYRVLRRLHVQLHAESIMARLTLWRWSYLLGMLLSFARTLCFDLFDTKFIDRQIERFRPDVIYLGHITILTKALMPLLTSYSIPIMFDEGGSGLIDSWKERGIWYKFAGEYVSRYSMINRMRFLAVKLVGILSASRIKEQWAWPADLHVFFNSMLNYRNAVVTGVPLNNARVIHSGIDTQKFSYRSRTNFDSPLICILPGRIEPRKGQMDMVRILAKMREENIDAQLLVVGENWVHSFFLDVKKEIEELSLEEYVSFIPMVSHDALADLYRQADLCFFLSSYQTGFSRVPLEAMACGCVVISYGNEGSDEIIKDGETGFLVPPGDPSGIINVVKELALKPERIKSVTESARSKVEMNYSMEKYVDEIEQMILNAVRAE